MECHAPYAQPLGGGRAAARSHGRRCAPRRDHWRRIGPGGASHTGVKGHGRRAGSGSPPPWSRPAEGPPLGRRVLGGGGGPRDPCPPAGMARIREVAPRTAVSRRRARVRVTARSRSGTQSTVGAHHGTDVARSSSATAASSSSRSGAGSLHGLVMPRAAAARRLPPPATAARGQRPDGHW